MPKQSLAAKPPMELKFHICCGLDVHKKSIVAAIATTDPRTLNVTYDVKSFCTTNSQIEKMHQWIAKHNCSNVCMESTGKYWIPIFNILEQDMNVVLTHPKYVKALKGKKTDNNDAKWIANLFRFDIVRSSFIPPAQIRALRELARYRIKLSYMRTAEKNRFQNSMTISRIRIDNILSDPFGKTASEIMQYLLGTTSFDEKKCRSLINGCVKANHDDIIDAIKGYEILPEQHFKMTHAKAHMDFINQSINEIETELFIRTRPYQQIINHLITCPGITELSAVHILAEIGTEMSVFEDEKHLASWAGLTPSNNESAGKKKSTRCSRGDHYLKPILVQCALAAIKSTKNPYFAIKYKRIKKRRGFKKAIIAIAHMMLVAIYHMIKDDTDFLPSDYEQTVHPKSIKNHKCTEAVAIQFFREQGVNESILQEIIKQMHPT